MATEMTQIGPGLKLLVAGMTVLLVAGLVLLVVGIARTAGEMGRDDATATPAPARLSSFGDLHIALPPGHRLDSLTAAGERLYLRTTGPDGGAAVLTVDAADGRLLGRILLEPER